LNQVNEMSKDLYESIGRLKWNKPIFLSLRTGVK
jgi:hypothetical protein